MVQHSDTNAPRHAQSVLEAECLNNHKGSEVSISLIGTHPLYLVNISIFYFRKKTHLEGQMQNRRYVVFFFPCSVKGKLANTIPTL